MSARVEISTQPPAVVEITDASSGVVVVASEVASPFVIAAQTAAADAQAARDEIRGVYYGAFASAPAADPLGNPPDAGDLYYDTTAGALMAWDGAQWVQYSPVLQAHTHPWSDITSTPSTLAGYGITDAVPQSRQIITGTGLTGGGDLSSDRSIAAVTLPQADWDAGTSPTEAVISPAKLAGAVVDQAIGRWEPFGGPGTDPTIWDHAVDGAVFSVDSPPLELDYDYMIDVFTGADAWYRWVQVLFQKAGSTTWTSAGIINAAGGNTRYCVGRLILFGPMGLATGHFVWGASVRMPPNNNHPGDEQRMCYFAPTFYPSSLAHQIDKFRIQVNAGTMQDYSGIGSWIRLYRRPVDTP